MNILEKVKILLPNASEITLNVYIDIAKDFATEHCNLITYDVRLDNIIVRMVVEMYNKQNAEGISSTSYSGVSESYVEDYTKSIYTALNKFRRIKFM